MPAAEYFRHESAKNGVEFFRIGGVHPSRKAAEEHRTATGRKNTTIIEGPDECLMGMPGEVDVLNLQGMAIPGTSGGRTTAEEEPMPNSERVAIFVHHSAPANGCHSIDCWERRSAVQKNVEPLIRLRWDDDSLRFVLATDLVILKGLTVLIKERHLPGKLLRELLGKHMIASVPVA